MHSLTYCPYACLLMYPARLVPHLRHRRHLHRAGLALAEALDRVVQRPPPRRGTRHRALSSLAEAKLILAECLERYNSGHPHSSLGMLPPARFAVAWRPEAGLGESA